MTSWVIVASIFLVGFYLERRLEKTDQKIEDVQDKLDTLYEWSGGKGRVDMENERQRDNDMSELMSQVSNK